MERSPQRWASCVEAKSLSDWRRAGLCFKNTAAPQLEPKGGRKDPRGNSIRLFRIMAPMSVVFLTNALDGRQDEGHRNYARCVGEAMAHMGVRVLGIPRVSPHATCMLFPGTKTIGALKELRPEVVVYVPTQSATLATFLRIASIRAITGARVLLIALQVRPLSLGSAVVARFFGPERILTPSEELLRKGIRLGLPIEFAPTGVDIERFAPVDMSTMASLRAKHKLNAAGRIILHVGHVKPLRNLEWMGKIADRLNVTALIIGSTSGGVDGRVLAMLRESGVDVRVGLVEDLQELYQLADVYVFPVIDERGAIGVPLSVLEAMGCDLPVVTTSFGGLPRMFRQTPGLQYVRSLDEALDAVSSAFRLVRSEVTTSELVSPYSWKNIAAHVLQEAIEICGGN